MQKHIKCLTQACEELGIAYSFIDKEQNVVSLNILGHITYFQISKTPFNLEVQSFICQDKMHSYELLKPVIKMPQTIDFLDWDTDEKYKKYLKFTSEDAILDKIDQTFDYPVVMKKNRGGLGVNVYLCENQEAVTKALRDILNHQSKDYDYVALAQEFIPTEEEYRLVCAFGKPMLAYYRGDASEFNQKYWEKGQQAILITDGKLMDELYEFVKPVFSIFDIGLVGFDIVRGKDEQLYLIEMNASPKFDHIMESSGEAIIVDLYKQCLKLYGEKHRLEMPNV